MRTIITTAAAAIALLCSGSAAAQLVVEANGARADHRWGGELGVGYALTVLPGFRITPAVGALIYAEDNGRYYFYDNGSGPDACRDSATGRYADKDRCSNTKARAYGRVEATYSVPLVATFGVGARISDEVRPYGTVAVPVAPKLSIKGNVGDGYYAVGLRLGF